MKKFWCVATRFFDSGKVKAVMYEVEAEEKPNNTMVENKMCDEYHDYFDNFKEAKDYWIDAQNA